MILCRPISFWMEIQRLVQNQQLIKIFEILFLLSMFKHFPTSSFSVYPDTHMDAYSEKAFRHQFYYCLSRRGKSKAATLNNKRLANRTLGILD